MCGVDAGDSAAAATSSILQHCAVYIARRCLALAESSRRDDERVCATVCSIFDLVERLTGAGSASRATTASRGGSLTHCSESSQDTQQCKEDSSSTISSSVLEAKCFCLNRICCSRDVSSLLRRRRRHDEDERSVYILHSESQYRSSHRRRGVQCHHKAPSRAERTASPRRFSLNLNTSASVRSLCSAAAVFFRRVASVVLPSHHTKQRILI